VTTITGARAIVEAISARNGNKPSVQSLQECTLSAAWPPRNAFLKS